MWAGEGEKGVARRVRFLVYTMHEGLCVLNIGRDVEDVIPRCPTKGAR